MLEDISDAFWSPEFWLGRNVTWNDLLTKEPGVYYPRLEDLKDSLYVALLLSLMRILIEQFFMKPIGRLFGLKDNKKLFVKVKNAFLEKASANMSKKDMANKDYIKMLAKKCDLTERKVQHYMQAKRRSHQPSKVVKFSESGWRFVFYLCLFYYGLYILWDTIWLWDSNHNWIGHPFQSVTSGIYWYYIMELGYYISSSAFSFIDVKRKDFKEMLLHHAVTVLLLVFSWICNYVRVGSVILLLHDAADYWMELAKMANYLKYNSAADIFFVVFFVVWVCTRLIIYPYWCIRSVLVESPVHNVAGHSRVFFSVLLVTLQLLHIIWTFFILKIIRQTYVVGEKAKDSRSDSEEESVEEEDTVSSMAEKSELDVTFQRNGTKSSSH